MITADDFGAAEQVNEAVERGHREGVLSAASLMVAGAAAADAIGRARRMPGLGVGLHVVLVEGRPLLPPESLPDLVGPDGRFRTDLGRLGLDIFLRPRVRAQATAEIEAQFAAFAATGLPLDHVNAHKHFHLHPTIGALLLSIGRRHGMRAVRAPVEPHGIVRAVDPAARPDRLAGPWAKLQRRRLIRAGIAAPDQVFGLAWSGAMTASRIAALLDSLPDGLTELYLHPATGGGFEGAAPGYRYAEEFAALTNPAVRAALERSGAALGSFAGLTGTRGAA